MQPFAICSSSQFKMAYRKKLFSEAAACVVLFVFFRGLSGSVVRALDLRLRGHEFNSWPVCYQVTILGKLFTPTHLPACVGPHGLGVVFDS